MARLLSPVASVIRGSVAGITYTANQYHQIIMRQRTAPVQPGTTFQTLMKTAFVGSNDVWENLSDDDRRAWDQFADTCLFSGPLGKYTVPGKQIFMAGRSVQEYVNTRLLAVPSFVTTAPNTTGFLQLKNIAPCAPTGPGTGVGVSITADTTDDSLCLVQISKPFNPTRERYKGPFQADTAQAVIIPKNTSVVVDFLGLEVDRIYFIRVKGVSDDAAPRISPIWIVRGVAEVVGP